MRGSQLDVVKYISSTIDNQVPWMVVGSFNCAIQGMNWQPNDIDMITTEQGSKVFKEKLLIFGGTEEEKSRKNFTWRELNVSIKGEAVSVFYELGRDKIYTEFLLKGFRKKPLLMEGYFTACGLKKKLKATERLEESRKRKKSKNYWLNRKSNFLDIL